MIVSVLLWLWVFVHLHYEWTLNPNYNYGWAVPFLAAFLFYLRWGERPAPRSISKRAYALFRPGQWLLLVALLPIHVIEEANPDWRLLGWILALIAVAYSLLVLGRAGGVAWVKHFAFPVCFPLVAVPWFVQFENAIVQNLARAVAATAVEIVGWFGVAAFRVGNLIELPNGFVGVDDACSGVKTLQAAIMVCLFLGELLRLSAKRRLFLVACGCFWVFACNTVRGTILVWLAAKQGFQALARWHDLVGTVVLLAGIGGLGVIAFFLRDKGRRAVSNPGNGASRIGSIAESCIMLAWLALAFFATEFWYRHQEHALVAQPGWSVAWPTDSKSFQILAIPESTRTILRYDQARTAMWDDSSGKKCWAFFARWKPKRTALQLVRSHSPEICLPAAGRLFKRELPPITVRDTKSDLTFRMYEFEQNSLPLFVFVCIQEDKSMPGQNASANEWNTRGRLLAAWNGQRNLGQRMLEIAVLGF
ncbi:MAG: hypothetical protein QOI34_262, partial [Verrucomicrobiota bacterium]